MIKTAYLPMSEVLFIPAKSAIVTAVNDQVGSVVGAGSSAPSASSGGTAPTDSGAVLQLSAGGLGITGTIGQDQVSLVRSGMKVAIYSADFGVSARGVVTRVSTYNSGSASGSGSDSGAAAVAGPGFTITVAPAKALPSNMIGDNVQLTITAAATPAPVLVVPSAAIFTMADGSTDVTVLHGIGQQATVPVHTGASADGAVAVTAVTAGSLTAGEQVVIGTGQ